MHIDLESFLSRDGIITNCDDPLQQQYPHVDDEACCCCSLSLTSLGTSVSDLSDPCLLLEEAQLSLMHQQQNDTNNEMNNKKSHEVILRLIASCCSSSSSWEESPVHLEKLVSDLLFPALLLVGFSVNQIFCLISRRQQEQYSDRFESTTTATPLDDEIPLSTMQIVGSMFLYVSASCLLRRVRRNAMLPRAFHDVLSLLVAVPVSTLLALRRSSLAIKVLLVGTFGTYFVAFLIYMVTRHRASHNREKHR